MQFAMTGHQNALTILFDRYHRLIFNVALRIVRDPGEAEDVVQNVFLDVFRARANFDSGRGTLKVWLLQYAYHRALHRKRHLVSNHFYCWENLEAAIELGSGRQLWGELPEAVRLVEEMLGKLKPCQRQIVELTYYDERLGPEGLSSAILWRMKFPNLLRIPDMHLEVRGFVVEKK